MISIIIPGDLCAGIEPGSWLWYLSGCGFGFSIIPQIALFALPLFVAALSRHTAHR